MVKKCNCYINLSKAIAKGMSFDAAYRKYHKTGYHEHQCECKCGCTHNTLGYAKCVPCSFGDCKVK